MSKFGKPTKQDLLEQYEEFKKEFDPRLEEVTIYRNKLDHSELMLTKDMIFQSKEDFEKFKKQIDIRLQAKNDNVLTLLHVLGKIPLDRLGG